MLKQNQANSRKNAKRIRVSLNAAQMRKLIVIMIILI